MSLEEQFYKEVTPEGKNNYLLSGQAKILLLLCKAVDELKAAQQSARVDDAYCTCEEFVIDVCTDADLCAVCLNTGYRRVSPTILAECSCQHGQSR